jgi:hypothetical protein
MDCRDFEKDILLFREISDEQKEVLKLHIESCSNCKKLFDEATQMETLVKEMAGPRAVPANASKLTSRIMEGIHLSPSLSWSDRILTILQNTFTKMALGTLSTILLITFSLEFFNDAPQTRYENPIASGFTILNSKLFKEETARQRNKSRFFAECTSPFKPQHYLIDCAKSKLK